jgi:hypothetical protein
VVEQKTLAATTEVLKATPLATVRAADSSGPVMILMDCNVYGASDSNDKLRKCPMGKEIFQKLLKAVLHARQGDDEELPDKLQIGDIYVMLDGGKERVRLFQKPLQVKKTGKDPDRNHHRKVVVHCTEASVRARRGRNRGNVKLTQTIHITKNIKTKIDPCEYSSYPGSTNSDLLGPVVLDDLLALPKLSKVGKLEYLGTRRVLIGGKETDDDDDDDDDAEEEVVATDVGDSKQAPKCQSIGMHCQLM